MPHIARRVGATSRAEESWSSVSVMPSLTKPVDALEKDRAGTAAAGGEGGGDHQIGRASNVERIDHQAMRERTTPGRVG